MDRYLVEKRKDFVELERQEKEEREAAYAIFVKERNTLRESRESVLLTILGFHDILRGSFIYFESEKYVEFGVLDYWTVRCDLDSSKEIIEGHEFDLALIPTLKDVSSVHKDSHAVTFSLKFMYNAPPLLQYIDFVKKVGTSFRQSDSYEPLIPSNKYSNKYPDRMFKAYINRKSKSMEGLFLSEKDQLYMFFRHMIAIEDDFAPYLTKIVEWIEFTKESERQFLVQKTLKDSLQLEELERLRLETEARRENQIYDNIQCRKEKALEEARLRVTLDSRFQSILDEMDEDKLKWASGEVLYRIQEFIAEYKEGC